MTKSIKTLFEGTFQVAEVEPIETDQGRIYVLHIENMTHGDVLAIRVTVPEEVIEQYDLEIGKDQ